MSSDKVLIFPVRKRYAPFDRAVELQFKTMLSAAQLQADIGTAFVQALGIALVVCSASFKVDADLIFAEIDEAGSKMLYRAR